MSFDNVQFITRPHVKVEPPTTHETKVLLSTIDDLLDIQCSPGNWNANPYMHGLANGMILIRSLISYEEPDFLSTPSRWLDEEYNNLAGGERGVFGSAFISCIEEARNKLTKKLKEDYPHEDYYLISEEMPLDELIPTVMLRYGPQNSRKGFSIEEEAVISVYWDSEASSWVAQLEGDVPHPFPADQYENEDVVKESALAVLTIKRPERVTPNTEVIITGRPPVVGRTKTMRRRRTLTAGRLHRQLKNANRVAPLEFEVGAVCLFDFLQMEPTQFEITRNFPVEVLHVAGKWIINTDYDNDPTGEIQKAIPRLNEFEAAELYELCGGSRLDYIKRGGVGKRTAALRPADKRVVDDFVEGLPNDKGRILWTDGDVLMILGLGGVMIARSEDDDYINVIDGYSTNLEQSIVRYLKKIVPPRWWRQTLPYGTSPGKGTGHRFSSTKKKHGISGTDNYGEFSVPYSCLTEFFGEENYKGEDYWVLVYKTEDGWRAEDDEGNVFVHFLIDDNEANKLALNCADLSLVPTTASTKRRRKADWREGLTQFEEFAMPTVQQINDLLLNLAYEGEQKGVLAPGAHRKAGYMLEDIWNLVDKLNM